MAKHLYIKTFGCQMNERDSEIIEQLLANQIMSRSVSRSLLISS